MSVDGRTLPLSTPQQVSLLALLLLHANQTLSSEAAAEALWGEQLGRSTKRLQMAVSRLRKALGAVR